MGNVIIGQNLVEVKCKKKKYEIRSPKYLGSGILWNSKMLMLDWIYNVLWTTYTPETAHIMYSDTDSVMIKIKGLNGATKEQRYDDFLGRFSPYLRELHFVEKGDITIGKMKCECLFDEGVWLKPKTYSLLENAEEHLFNKGVIMKQNNLKHQHYKNVLLDNNVEYCVNTIIRKTTQFGQPHMNTMNMKKVGLIAWYDIR